MRASGTTSSALAARPNIAACHPNAAIVAASSGAAASCPIEPPALTVPSAKPRDAGDTRCATIPISNGALPAAAPAAPAAAITSTSSTPLPARGTSAVRAATRTPPAASSRGAPMRRTSTPHTGCAMPHASALVATARLTAAGPNPLALLIGPMNSPHDERDPAATASTSEAARMTAAGEAAGALRSNDTATSTSSLDVARGDG